jgi:hypothetical protein
MCQLGFFSLLVFLFVPLLLSGLSCTKSELPEYSELNSLRVLALVADQPEVAPGSAVQITPWISDVPGTSAPTYKAEACVVPGLYFGATPTCEGNSTSVSLGQGTVTTLTAGTGFTGAANSFNVTVPLSAVIFALSSDREKFNGVPYLVTYELTSSTGKVVKAFRRILVSTKVSADGINSNPSLATNIYENGQVLGAVGASETRSVAVNLSGSTQTYKLMISDGSTVDKSEEYVTTWFVTDGEMKYIRSVNGQSNEFKASDTWPTSRTAQLIAVTHDERGGVTVVSRVLP